MATGDTQHGCLRKKEKKTGTLARVHVKFSDCNCVPVPGELVNYARDLVINGDRLASNAKLDQIQFKSLVFY
jgi:hypothetical protein